MSDTTEIVWQTHPAINRYEGNPILAAEDIPYEATLVFNAGVVKYEGRYVMVFRNDIADRDKGRVIRHNMGLAYSDDGIEWEPADKPLGAEPDHPLYGAIDPRLNVLDGKVYLTYWINHRHPAGTGHGVRSGLAVTEDFENWEVLHLSMPDNRNWVIFPERFDGKILSLQRPFPMYAHCRQDFDMWICASPEGRYWGDAELLLRTQDVPWVNDKIGPAHQPIRTEKGWFSFYHGVDVDDAREGWGWRGNWKKRYSLGVMLQDLENPRKVLGISKQPVMVPEPEVDYEAHGYRDYVIFPGGAVLEDDGELKIYYGAADTVECLAFAQIDELLALCCDPIG